MKGECNGAAALLLLLSAQFFAARSDEPILSRVRREPVDSSAIAGVGYSKRLHALEIEFRNGAIYRYLDVPGDTYRALMSATSKTAYYDDNVRHHFRSVHVRPQLQR
jgi:hypothetical protein